jgi:hypothetical protein
MTGVFDTLIQLQSDVAQADDVAQVGREISALYPPESSQPNFQLTEIVERDGKRFVRLSTLAGSMHFMLRRGVKMQTFPRVLLCTTDREVGNYEYFS